MGIAQLMLLLGFMPELKSNTVPMKKTLRECEKSVRNIK